MAKKRLTANMDELVSDLELLVEMSQQMLSAVNLAERCKIGLQVLSQHFHCPRVLIGLIDTTQEHLVGIAGAGFNIPAAKLSLPLTDRHDLIITTMRAGLAHYYANPAKAGDQDSALLTELAITENLALVPLIRKDPRAGKNGRKSELQPKNCWQESAIEARDQQRWQYDASFFQIKAVAGVLIIDTGRADSQLLPRLLRFADLFTAGVVTALENDDLNNLVTQLKREKAWEESILNSVADPIVLTDLDNRILLQNRRAAELFSMQEQDSSEKRRAIELNIKLFKNYLSNRKSAAIESSASDIPLMDPVQEVEHHFEVISTPSIDSRDEMVGIVTVFRDVTDLRRAGQKLEMNFQRLQQAEAQARRERDQLDLILENVGVPIIVCDINLNFMLINQRAEPFFQTQKTSNSMSQESVETNTKQFTALISKFAASSEPVFKTEIELLEPQNGARTAHDLIAVKIFDEPEKISAIVSILHDLTKLRELERRRVEQQLFKSEKMAAIGLMAAQIAHEVNNPLEVIKNSLYLLETTSSVTRQEPQTLRFLEIARKETERVSGIIKQMLGFARPSNETEPVLVKINEVIEEVLVLVEKTLKQGRIKTEANLANNLPAVLASADQLKQVFLNLIINSQHAMEGGGSLTITTSVQNDMSEEGLINPSVIVEFIDTGIGIDERDLVNIFEPFYSLNKGKKGTGLGLWVSLGIVRSYGGRIKVKSTVSKGSSFSVILPITGTVASQKKLERKV